MNQLSEWNKILHGSIKLLYLSCQKLSTHTRWLCRKKSYMAKTVGLCHRGQTHRATALIFLPVVETVLRSNHGEYQLFILISYWDAIFFMFQGVRYQKKGRKGSINFPVSHICERHKGYNSDEGWGTYEAMPSKGSKAMFFKKCI